MAKAVTSSTAQLIYNPAGQQPNAQVKIQALSGGTHYIGQSGVTTSSGLPLNQGDSVTLNAPATALYAVNGSSGTLEVSIGR